MKMYSKTCLLALLGGLFTATVQAEPTIAPQKNPPAAASYSKIAPDWQVSSVYGPRVASGGSKFHRGIDYNQQQGDGDLGVILTARSAGSITEIKQGWLTIQSTDYSFDYLHIFDNKVVSNKNTVQAGYSSVNLSSTAKHHQKVVLSKVKSNNGKATCNAIFFYDTHSKLVKILTKQACSDFVEENSKIKAQVTVAANEAIATMGKWKISNAHLHLQLNGGADNALTKIIHPTGLIAGKTERFEVKLLQDTFTDKVLPVDRGLLLKSLKIL